jgi:MoaA/NifB/PqqE/SkfB family radical SAM enzyme
VHVIPIRRCNIDCGYCNEYDKVSPPVPFETMIARIDWLADLGTSVVAFSGGEPLLHPQLDDLIRRIRTRGMMAGLITNGFLLSKDRIEALNTAGLDYLQISIDNVTPDDVSKKSLKTLDAPDRDGRSHSKLKLLREHAAFQVNINSVLGGGTRNPEDARTINRRARELGFTTSIGIIHDGLGQLKPLAPVEREIYEDVSRQIDGVTHVVKNIYSGIRDFQANLVDGKPNEWRCRAGARYLYICENGLVHYCSQQRGMPGIPLEQYTLEHIRREFNAPKSCAPYCTIGCVHRVSFMDFWRKPQTCEYSV